MTRRGSLVRRLVMSLLAVTVVFSMIAAAAGGFTIHRELNESMDASLKQVARRLLPVVIDDLFKLETPQTIDLPDGLSEEDDVAFVYQVRDAAGKILLHSHDAPAKPLTAVPTKGFVELDGWHIYTEAAVSDSIFIQVAQTETHRDEEIFEAALGFVLPILILMPVSALVAWLVLARFLKPVDALRDDIGRRRGDFLDAIPTDDLPDELASIAASVNSLMSRLRSALESEKEFAANAAHELRTPLAAALAQVERLILEAPNEAQRHRGQQIRAALSGLHTLSEKLLQLARADAGIAIAGPPLDLGQIARLVVDEFEQRSDSRGRVKLYIDPAAAKAAIDADALAILYRNLLENGLRHGASGQPVVLTVGPGARISVANQGPVVPEDALAALTRRFERGATKSNGAGLGLAIVSKIVSQVGGSLILASPASGRNDGFEAIITFGRGPTVSHRSLDRGSQ